MATSPPKGGAAAASGANVLFQSRDELRKQKELEDARKSGLIPAEKDEEGRDINPHIPQYIAKAPWYLSQDHPSLKHQRFKEDSKISIDKWYKRGLVEDTPKKFREGACANCGAVTHTLKDCTERPRKKGAKWNHRDLRPDEIIQTPTELDWDGKRDRWGGYDGQAYDLVVRDYELAELQRKRKKEAELEQMLHDAKSRRKKRALQAKITKLKEDRTEHEDDVDDDDNDDDVDDDDHDRGDGGGDDDGGSGGGVAVGRAIGSAAATAGGAGVLSGGGGDNDIEGDSDSDSDAADSDSESESEGSDCEEDAKIRDFDQANAVVGTTDDRTRTTTRNLRIREDTAKYLINLDLDSAFYDPKTRSMRDNPVKHLKDDERGLFQGDNVARITGDAHDVTNMEVFAWEAYKHGAGVHFQGLPTQLQEMYRQHLEKKEKLVESKQKKLVGKYGGAEHLKVPREVLFSQSEAYVEYSRDGTVKRDKERVLVVSKYEEDVHEYGHSSVWGSWYDMDVHCWGYKCCKKMTRGAACTAVVGAD